MKVVLTDAGMYFVCENMTEGQVLEFPACGEWNRNQGRYIGDGYVDVKLSVSWTTYDETQSFLWPLSKQEFTIVEY